MTDATAPLRYALVGTGHRSEMYIRALFSTHADAGSLVAWCDTNPVRMAYYGRLAAQLKPDATLPTEYSAEQFDQMLDEVKPDVLIVTVPDYLHHEYIIKGLERGLRVIVEKPLTTTKEKAQAIVEAANKSTGSVTLTFNYRYSPRNTVVKELISSGKIGQVTSVHFEWLLDTGHGADYFRRWHREQDKSGSLLIHKASHHFDLVNWWLADVPKSVNALAALRFYGEENAIARGESPQGVTSREDPNADTNPFAIDISKDDRLRQLYLDAEHVDGYQRDRNVFGKDIDITDTMNLLVGYTKGAALTYSLYAYAPWEGYRVAFNGTKGRIELDVVENSSRDPKVAEAIDPSSMSEEQLAQATGETELRPRSQRVVLQEQWGKAIEIPIPVGEGGHGGGDIKLLNDLFLGTDHDPLQHQADYVDGLKSISVGIAGNEALQTGQTVLIDSLGLPLKG